MYNIKFSIENSIIIDETIKFPYKDRKTLLIYIKKGA